MNNDVISSIWQHYEEVDTQAMAGLSGKTLLLNGSLLPNDIVPAATAQHSTFGIVLGCSRWIVPVPINISLEPLCVPIAHS